jgi:hypothetical protein
MISCTAHVLQEDPRSNGFTLMYRTRFENIEDMNYYDDGCAAHAELKRNIHPKLRGKPMTVHMEA